jgi:hypothetical protein
VAETTSPIIAATATKTVLRYTVCHFMKFSASG